MNRKWVQAIERHIPYEEGNVPIPSPVYDLMASDMSGNDVKIIMVILANSLGEQQMYAQLSYDDIQSKTGIPKEKLSFAIESCIQKGYVAKGEVRNNKTIWLLGEILFSGVNPDGC